MHDTAKDAEKIGAKLGEDIPESTRTAPERIWLCLSDEEGDEAMPFPRETGEVTWAEDQPVAVTVEYVRADLFVPNDEAEYILNLCRARPDMGNKQIIADMREVFAFRSVRPNG